MNTSYYKLLMTFLIVIGMSLTVYSQSVKVSGFRMDEMDLSAQLPVKYDINEDPCGLLKVRCPIQGVIFEGGGVLSYEYYSGEYWIYMIGGSEYITIKVPGVPTFDFDFSESIKGKMTYVMTVAYNKINAFSYIVPGLGQIELGNKTEGYATIAGEMLLLGGGVISSIAAKKQLDIMRDVDVSLEDFMTAKRKYNTQKAINVTCYVAAATLYGFHLYRVYYLSKKARTKGFTSLAPTIMNTDESMALGLSININF